MVRRNAGNDVKRASLFFVTLTRSVRMFVQPLGCSHDSARAFLARITKDFPLPARPCSKRSS